MASVTFDQVTKVYPNRGGDVTALQNFTIEVNDGELTVLLGPSGSGKTTALRLVAGLDRPSAGSVRIGGRVVDCLPPRERYVAWVGQEHALYPHLDVFGNLAFGLRMTGVPEADIRRRIAETAEMLRIEPLLRRRPDELSGGECQRVALGRAMVRRPDVFLLDEPLSSLDATLRHSLRLLIRQWQLATRSTIIHVTHDQGEAMSLADRIAVIHGGKLQQAAAPMELHDRPANRFVAGFVGVPPMNFALARLVGDGAELSLECLGDRFALPSRGFGKVPLHDTERTVVLGVRPEHVDLKIAPLGDTGKVLFNGFRVELVEPQGHDELVHLRSPGNDAWIVRGRRGTPLESGVAVGLLLNPSHIHLFANDASGERIN